MRAAEWVHWEKYLKGIFDKLIGESGELILIFRMFLNLEKTYLLKLSRDFDKPN